MLRQIIQSFAILLLVMAAPALAATDGGLEPERALGNPSAPVTIIEYSSLTCPHCADFHHETLPQVKGEYIDTGKVYFIFRDFPLDSRGATAALIARCVDPSRYYEFVTQLFRDQRTWALADDPIAELRIRARLAGMSETDFDACLKNDQLFQSIKKEAERAEKVYGVKSTPSFLINGRLIRGALPFDGFKREIDDALSQAKATPAPDSKPAPGGKPAPASTSTPK